MYYDNTYIEPLPNNYYSDINESSYITDQPIEELSWTIPPSFSFSFPDKQTSTQVTQATAKMIFTDTPSCDSTLTSHSCPIISPCGTPSTQQSANPTEPPKSGGTSSTHQSIHPTDLSKRCLSAISLRDRKQWQELKDYITDTCFPTSEHSLLQNLFYEAVYEMYKERRKLQTLTPPQRYKMRKSNPLPPTISSVLFSANNHFDDKTKSILEAAFKKNRTPCPVTVAELSDDTGLSHKQIVNFFRLKRNRNKNSGGTSSTHQSIYPTDLSKRCLSAISLRDLKQWQELKDYITDTCFPTSEHPLLQNLFYEAVYEMYKERRKLQTLTPPQRYKMRKSNPLPPTISSVLFSANNHFDDKTKSILEAAFKKNRTPCPVTVAELSDDTGLSPKQIVNFFRLKRNRNRK